ncbi:MAG: hypothetical protein P8N02_19045 [Actinomycetota bacterium]|jgi:indole-3-acetate monooxygenase|nr:hypothetical protein [Actinomycetota bacterium]
MTVYPDPIESVAELKPTILAARHETEELRETPPSIGAELAQRGFGRLCLPADAPGHELDAGTYMTVFESLAACEASVALVVFNNCLPALVSRHLDSAVRAEIFANPHGMYANSTRPSGRAVRSADGYTLTGRWSLVTGCRLAEWFAFMTMEWDPATDSPVKAGRSPRLLMAMVPAAEVEILDTWRAAGVRGSGSHDAVVADVDVPTERVVDFASPNQMADLAIGRVPWMSMLAAAHGSISLGIAAAATAEFVQLVAGKKALDTGATVAEHPALQVEFLDVDNGVQAARARLRSCMERVWGHAATGTEAPVEAIADVFGAARFAANTSKALTEVALRWGGTSALYTDRVIERAWRDVQAINQHVITGPVMAEQAGRVRLGLEPRIPAFTW